MLPKLFIHFILCILPHILYAQPSLQQQIESIIKKTKAKVGVAVLYDSKELSTVNNDKRYAMLSTFKFPVALAVLNQLEKQNLPLKTEIFVAQSDLLPDTYSPLRNERPEGNFYMPVSELIKYSVSFSDNNACDILIKYLGSIKNIQNYINQSGISDIVIAATENQMHQKTEYQYINKIRPSAAVKLLEKFLEKELLSGPYQEFLEKIMIETTTGKDKLKGALPSDIIIGHKTGSSDRDSTGMKIADNDIGFVYLPNGKRYTIAVFVMDSMEDDKTNASVIAQISKIVYDHYNKE